MRGMGRVYRPKVRGKPGGVWYYDYTLRGCGCGECNEGGRHRDSTHKTTRAEALAVMNRVVAERAAGR